MTESDRGMLGEGNVRWDDLFRGLQEIDFNGNLVLENFSNSVPVWRKPYLCGVRLNTMPMP